MRGKGILQKKCGRFSRITPAYAGKSERHQRQNQEYQDHPRLCGEKAHNMNFGGILLGSPPPMRGKGFPPPVSFLLLRITPAYAGKSYNSEIDYNRPEDHPRLCGEKAILVCLRRISTGSPPPMRGKGLRDFLKSTVYRITPAYAGKSATGVTSSIVKKDHPRLCGEK